MPTTPSSTNQIVIVSNKNEYFTQVKESRTFQEYIFEDIPATLNIFPTYRAYQRFYLGFHTHLLDGLLKPIGGFDFSVNNDLLI